MHDAIDKAMQIAQLKEEAAQPEEIDQ